MTVVGTSTSTTSSVDSARQEPGLAPRSLRLAYLIPEYPKVSHTFIRREIAELERSGHSVLRLSIRDTRAMIADDADRVEAEKTIVCLGHGLWQFVGAVIGTAVRRPVRFQRALVTAFAMGRRNDRGMLRHIAYFIEACLLLHVLGHHCIQHVHVHFGTNAAAVARLIRCLGGPGYSMTVHGPDEFDSPIAFRLREKVADALFVAAISNFCTAQLRRWISTEHWDRLHIIRCTVDDDYLVEPTRIPPESRTLLSIGRLSPEKGQLLLVEAFAKLIDDGVDAELVIVGDGDLRPVLEARASELGVGDRIRITGWLSGAEIRDHLLRSRVLVQPSFAEGLPVVIMEALAMARPVVSSTIAGVPELVHDGVNGWLIPAGDVESITRAMQEALATPSTRLDEMGKAGHEQVARDHRARTEAARLAKLFDRYVPHDADG